MSSTEFMVVCVLFVYVVEGSCSRFHRIDWCCIFKRSVVLSLSCHLGGGEDIHSLDMRVYFSK